MHFSWDIKEKDTTVDRLFRLKYNFHLTLEVKVPEYKGRGIYLSSTELISFFYLS